MDLFFTPAFAQSSGGGGAAAGGDPFSLIFMLAAFGLIFYFLVFRPQQRRMKEHQEMVNNLRRGDEIMTAGGMLAKVTRVKEGEDEVEVEISDGVKARFVKSTIASVLTKPEPAKAEGGAKPTPRAGAKPGGKAKPKPEAKAEKPDTVDEATEAEKPEAEKSADEKAAEPKAAENAGGDAQPKS